MMREKFSEGFWGFVICFVLFIGLLLVAPCSNPESDMYIHFINGYQSWLYSFIIVVFLIQQAMVRWPKRASLGDVNNLKPPVEESLEAILRDYHAHVSKKTTTRPCVRVNIMLPTRYRLKRGFLKIYYYYPIAYSDDEIALKWKSGEGTCGYAWAKKRTVIYDSVNMTYKAPEKRLEPKHIAVVGDIKSVLSIPLWDRKTKKVIAVLNLDSKSSNMDKTYFDNPEIVKDMKARSQYLSPLLEPFYDGVSTQ